MLSVILLNSCSSKKDSKIITMATLLEEMADRSTLSKKAKLPFVVKQVSSYSRDSKNSSTAKADALFRPEKGRDWGQGWFENHDMRNYIRMDSIDGQVENVMFDHEGPGVVAAIWATGGYDKGSFRIYIDEDPEPVVDLHVTELTGGSGLVGKPYSFYAPEKAEKPQWRGRNLILPIPYAKKCKITHVGGGGYYHIIYREYPKTTQVESFSGQSIVKYKKEIDHYGEILNENPQIEGHKLQETKKVLQPGEALTVELKGEQAINYIKTKLLAADENQALRSTVLEVSFDGQPTVWCPVGQFFGVGYTTRAHRSYYIRANSAGDMESRWVMPFKEKAVVSLRNYGKEEVTVEEFEIVSNENKWDDRSMYFHAAWKETRKLESETRSDYNFISIQGEGVFVGDNLTLYNSFPDISGRNWWGEGDEKIYVDDETFPSHFGTGTEDYYCYAWCRPQPFSSLIATQPIGEGNKTPGITSNNRYRLLDAIPFNKSFKFDMEIWHPHRAKMNYSPATFWYAKPGAKWNVKPDPKGVKQKVALFIRDVVNN